MGTHHDNLELVTEICKARSRIGNSLRQAKFKLNKATKSHPIQSGPPDPDLVLGGPPQTPISVAAAPRPPTLFGGYRASEALRPSVPCLGGAPPQTPSSGAAVPRPPHLFGGEEPRHGIGLK